MITGQLNEANKWIDRLFIAFELWVITAGFQDNGYCLTRPIHRFIQPEPGK